MTFEEFLSSPYLAVIGEKMLQGNKDKLYKRYADRNKLAKLGQVVLLGDSIAEYYPVSEFFDFPIYDRGVGGDTSSETKMRLNSVVLPLKPSKAVLWVGTNDLQCGISAEETFANVTYICKTLQSVCGSKIYVMSVVPVDMQSDDEQIRMCVGKRTDKDIKQLNDGYKVLCQKFGWTYVDVYSLLVSNGNLASEYSEDGLHLSTSGYVVVTKALKDVLSEISG